MEKNVWSPAQRSFRGVSFQKIGGIRGIYEKPSLQPKKNIASIGLTKGYLHPLSAKKNPQGFHKQRFFSVKKNHRQRSALGSHGPFFFSGHLTQPAPLVHPYQFVVHFLPATSHRPYSCEQAPPDIDFLRSDFRTQPAPQSVPPL